VLSAFALITVAVAAVYFVAGTGDDGGGGPIAAVTSTPTRKPTVSPTEQPTSTPTLPAATPTSSPSPSPVPGTPRPGAEFFLWNDESKQWQDDDLEKDSSSAGEGDILLFLFKLNDVKPGETYQIEIDYFDCGLSPGRSFDYLAAASSGDTPQLATPGPGRVRPDSQVPVPDDPGVGNDGGSPAYLSAWGGTFQRAPELSPVSATCTGDKKLSVSVLAQSSTLYVEWGGHLASVTDWLGEGAASAKLPFGMSAMLQGASAERIEVLVGAVSK
jgi:hypothetical protein